MTQFSNIIHSLYVTSIHIAISMFILLDSQGQYVICPLTRQKYHIHKNLRNWKLFKEVSITVCPCLPIPGRLGSWSLSNIKVRNWKIELENYPVKIIHSDFSWCTPLHIEWFSLILILLMFTLCVRNYSILELYLGVPFAVMTTE